MKENKNIDRLFQEKFRNLDVTPPEEAWENIAFRLKDKKKRRIVPFWWKLSGIAAGFVIGLGIYTIAFNDTKTPNEVVIENKVDTNKNNGTNPNELNKINNNEIVSSESKATQNNSIDEKNIEQKTNSDLTTSVKNSTGVATNSDENKGLKNSTEGTTSVKNNTGVATNSDGNKGLKNSTEGTTSVKNNTGVAVNSDGNKSLKNNSEENTSVKNNTGVAVNSDENKGLKNNSEGNNNVKNNTGVAVNSDGNKSLKNNSEGNNNVKNSSVVVVNSDENKSLKNNSEGITSVKNNTIAAANSDAEQLDKKELNKNIDLNKSINTNQIIAENLNSDLKKDEIKKIDSTSIASVVPNAMEELLNEKEKKTSKEPKLNRWQLSSNVAPIYFSSTSNGSPLDSELKNNSKTYNTNFSYGLGVNYAVNKKVKLRTGLNAVSIDYDTNDVVFYQNANAKSLDHVKTNSMGSLIQIENKSSSEVNPEIASTGNVLKKFNSVVNQKIGYLEIPFELSYKVIDKKFGVDVIGGVSTLLLNQNEVSVISSGTQITIGEANNLNDIHFSTNVGLGFKYGFFKKFEARIEPVFKYQINTFVQDSGDFKPYFFGVYTGISFTF